MKRFFFFVQSDLAESDEQKLERWLKREPTAEEQLAAAKLQKVWRGFYIRKAFRVSDTIARQGSSGITRSSEIAESLERILHQKGIQGK